MKEMFVRVYLVLIISPVLGIAEASFPKLIKHSDQKEFGESND